MFYPIVFFLRTIHVYEASAGYLRGSFNRHAATDPGFFRQFYRLLCPYFFFQPEAAPMDWQLLNIAGVSWYNRLGAAAGFSGSSSNGYLAAVSRFSGKLIGNPAHIKLSFYSSRGKWLPRIGSIRWIFRKHLQRPCGGFPVFRQFLCNSPRNIRYKKLKYIFHYFKFLTWRRKMKHDSF